MQKLEPLIKLTIKKLLEGSYLVKTGVAGIEPAADCLEDSYSIP